MTPADKYYPRVLFLTSSAFNKVTGGGVTFTNLFAGWPEDRIATIHNDAVPVSTDVCTRYYRLGSAEIHKQGLLRYLEPKSFSSGNSTAAPATVDRSGKLRSMARLAKKLVFGNAVPDVGRLTPELEKWVAAYKPDVLYTILGTNAMMDLAKALRRRFGISLVIHLMDDWPSVAYRGGMLSWLARRRMRKLLGELVANADVRMGICEAMAREYGRRYGFPFVAFQNVVDMDKWQAYIKQDLATKRPVRLLYIGSVLPDAQLDALADCCAAVTWLASEGLEVVFDIYTPSFPLYGSDEKLGIGPRVRLHTAIANDEEVFAELVKADILLLPVNFNATTARYIRYSMPTKVPAYLFSGTPILVYGPSETAQARYAHEAGWGYLVNKRGQNSVAQAIRKLVEDMDLRVRLSRAARLAAFANHDGKVVRARFQAALRESVKNPSAPILK